ncbi:hypothetical protein PENTCL1PPCAC_5617, partial [Pristionchus entomophagus]
FETPHEIKTEAVEIKEEPIDDYADIKMEDDSVYQPLVNSFESTVDIKEESVEIKDELIDYYADIKQDELIANESSETDEMEKRRRPSRVILKPLKYADYSDYSDGDDEPSFMKERSESEKKRRSNKGVCNSELSSRESRVSKMNDTELKCPECEFCTLFVCSWINHLRKQHSTTPVLAGLALLCKCGNESTSDEHNRRCNVAKCTVIHKRDGSIRRLGDEMTTPKCVLCEVYPTTLFGYANHLRVHHKSSLKANGIYLICSCGLDDFCGNTRLQHSDKCDRRRFTLHELNAIKKDSSNTVEVKKRGRPSKEVYKSVKRTEDVEDSDGDRKPSLKKKKSESKKENNNERSSNKGECPSESTNNEPRASRMNDTDLECIKCDFSTRSVQSWYLHLRNSHFTTPALAGLALLCDCGNESTSYEHSRKCTIANFTIVRKRDWPIRGLNDAKATPKCVLCEDYPATVRAYAQHLRTHHKSSLKKCDRRQFSLHNLNEK